MSGAMEVFAARPTTAGPREKAVDPVCGIELADVEVAATLELAGATVAFCSQQRLQKFVTDPDRYQVRR